MVKNSGDWGREKARSRYYESGGRANTVPDRTIKERIFGDPGNARNTRMPPMTPTDSYRPPSQADRDKMRELSGDSGNKGYKRGGHVAPKNWEGSKKDVAEDKGMAKAAGMSMKKWEKSAMDKAHDQPSAQYKRGGTAKHPDEAQDRKLIKSMIDKAKMGKKEGGPIESPPLVPKEWPPHPLNPKGRR